LTAGDNISIVGDTISASGGGSGTTIDSTTDISCNTLTTVGDVNIGGVMIAPNQPCFRAYPSQNYTLNGSDFPSMPYDAIDIDNANGYNTSTYEYTVPVAGNWYFYWSCGAVQNKNCVTSIRKNDVLYDRCLVRTSTGYLTYDTNGGKGLSVILCAVGDVIRVSVNGTNQSASLASGGSDLNFTVNYLGFVASHTNLLNGMTLQLQNLLKNI
jgi:hypothetical protein